MSRHAVRFAFLFLMALTVAGWHQLTAFAAPVSVAITAQVTQVGDPDGWLGGKVQVGDTVTGTYTYDSTTVDSNAASDVGEYWHTSAPYGISLFVNGLTFRTDYQNPNFLLKVVDGIQDQYSIRSFRNDFDVSVHGEGITSDDILWQLDDPFGTALANDSLPTAPPAIETWQGFFPGLVIDSYCYGSEFFIRAQVTSSVRPHSVEDQAAGVIFDRFVTGFSSSYSAGTYVYGRWTNTELEAKFTGRTIRWVGPKQPSYGMADVYIDGVKRGTVDCYAPAAGSTLSSTIYESATLTEGTHTLKIRLAGARNVASSGNVVVIDRFEVGGAAPQGAGTRLNEQGSHATFTGTWVKAVNPTYTSSTYAYSAWSGPVYQATFTGTKVAWIGPKSLAYGKANVYIDGAFKGTIDCYSAATGWRYKIWESGTLSAGSHYIQIKPTHTKRSAATSYVVVVDTLDVSP